nr:ABC transporter substrate-binding protein [Lysinibacter cavernae]
MAALVVVAVLSGCTSGPTPGSELRIATPQPVTSFNAQTVFGDSPSNQGVLSATDGGFFEPHAEQQRVLNQSFGDVSVDSLDPLTVTYTLGDSATWSDGVAVSPADLLLAWAGISGVLNDSGAKREALIDQESGLPTAAFTGKTVFFDGMPNGLEHAATTPVVDEKTGAVTLVFDEPVVDWRLIFDIGVPAHVVAAQALGSADATEGQNAILAAIQNNDRAALASISRQWSTGFVASEITDAATQLVATGPYSVTAIGETLELTANDNYAGSSRASIETILVDVDRDVSGTIEAIAGGDLDVALVAPTDELLTAMKAAKSDESDVILTSGQGSLFEHLDLQFARSANGTFDKPEVRQAFLMTVPRQEIVDSLIGPFDADATPRDTFLLPQGHPNEETLAADSGVAAFAKPNIDKAKSMLASAGVKSPTVCILFDAQNARRAATFELIRASADQAGFVVTDCSSDDWLSKLGVPGAYDASLFAWETNAAVTTPTLRYGSKDAPANFNFYANGAVDAALLKLSKQAGGKPVLAKPADQAAILEQVNLSLTDPTLGTESVDALVKIEQTLWADAYGMPLYQQPEIVVHRAGVTGIDAGALTPGLLWNVAQWRVTG